MWGASLDERFSEVAVFVFFLVLYSFSAGSDITPFNAFVRQAFALLHRHAYIDAPQFIEHAQIGGFSYQLHPILPALLLLPYTAIWGMSINQGVFSIICGALDVALAWRLLGRLRLTLNARIWLTLFFGAGTILWYEAIHGTSWAVAMLVAIALTLLALDECFGNARPAIVGLAAGLAGLARYDLVLIWPIYLGLLYLRGRSPRELLWFMPGCILALAIYVPFNEVRYGSLFDLGLSKFAPGTPLFGWKYLVGNLNTILFMSPRQDATFPYFHPTFGGQALVFTSPAFLLALRANCRRIRNVLIAVAAF